MQTLKFEYCLWVFITLWRMKQSSQSSGSSFVSHGARHGFSLKRPLYDERVVEADRRYCRVDKGVSFAVKRFRGTRRKSLSMDARHRWSSEKSSFHKIPRRPLSVGK